MSESHLPTWMPSLPLDWATASIDQLAVRVGSGVTPTGGSEVYAESGVTFIRSQNVTNRGLSLEDAAFIDHKTHAQMSASEVYPFDVLLNITGASIGRCCFLPEGLGPANVNQHVCAIRFPKPDFHDAKFLASVLASPIGQSQIVRLNAGGNREGLNYQQLRSFRVPWPPKKVRSAVAEILTTVDEAMEQTEALVGKLEQMKAGLMHDLFTRGVTPDGHLRPTRQEAPHLYHQTPLGWLPKEWQVAPINAITSLCIDCPHTTPVLSDEGFLMARTSEIRDGRLRAEDSPRVSPEEYRSRVSRGMPMPGDIIFTREAPVGEAFVIPDVMEICLGQRVMLIRPVRLKCNPHFLLFQIYSSRVRQEFARIVGGTTNPHLNVDDVRRFDVALPGLDEQALIAARLSQIAGNCAAEEATLAKLRQQKQGLMQDLLTGRVRVV